MDVVNIRQAWLEINTNIFIYTLLFYWLYSFIVISKTKYKMCLRFY